MQEEEHIPHILKQYISSHGFSYLVEFKFKAKYVAKCERFTHVGLNQREEELVLISSALIHLQDYVQHAVWVQVETSCRQKEQVNKKRYLLHLLTQEQSCSDKSSSSRNLSTGAGSVAR